MNMLAHILTDRKNKKSITYCKRYVTDRASEALSEVMSTCIHPIFERCIQYTLDEYWQDIFRECAENKFPLGMRYNAATNTLYIKSAKKLTPIALPEEPVDVFKAMMKIFRNECEMKSSRDIEIQRGDLEGMKKQYTVDLKCDWKKIKPRSMKDQLIIEYVSRLKGLYTLSHTEVKGLLSVIQLGFQFKQLCADDIDYSNGVINGIDSIEFDEKTRKFYVARPQRAVSAKIERSVPPTKFNQEYDRFLKDYQKRFRPSAIN